MSRYYFRFTPCEAFLRKRCFFAAHREAYLHKQCFFAAHCEAYLIKASLLSSLSYAKSPVLSIGKFANHLHREFSAGCQPRCPVKTSIGVDIFKSSTRTTALLPAAGRDTQLKYQIGRDGYPVPYPAQLFTVLSHREHYCSNNIIHVRNIRQARFPATARSR